MPPGSYAASPRLSKLTTRTVVVTDRLRIESAAVLIMDEPLTQLGTVREDIGVEVKRRPSLAHAIVTIAVFTLGALWTFPAAGQETSSTTSETSSLPHQLSVAGSSFSVEARSDNADPTLRVVIQSLNGHRRTNVADIQMPEWLRKKAAASGLVVAVDTASLGESHHAVLLTFFRKSASQIDRGYRVGYDLSAGQTTTWRRIDAVDVSPIGRGARLEFEPSRDGDDHSRLLRVDRRLEETFCGANAHTGFAEQQWDPEDGQFEPKNAEQLFEKGTRLSASIPGEPLQGPYSTGGYQWLWTGTVRMANTDDSSDGDVDGPRDRPTELGDRRPGTHWRGTPWRGVWRDDSFGIDQPADYVSARVTDAAPVDAIRVVPGDADSPNTFEDSTAPSGLLVMTAGGESYVVDLPAIGFDRLAERGGVVIELPEPVTTRCLTVAPLATERGPKVSISEVTPVLSVDAPTREETVSNIVDAIVDAERPGTRRDLVQLAAGMEKTLSHHVQRRLESLLSNRGSESESKREDNTTSSTKERQDDADERAARLVSILGHLPSDRTIPVLVDLFEQSHEKPAHTPYRQAVRRSLGEHGPAAADALIEMLQSKEATPTAQLATLRLLNRVARPKQRLALVEQLGEGGREVREERCRTVAAAGEPALGRVLQIVARWPSVEAGRDALRVAARIGQRPEVDALVSHSRAGAISERLAPALPRRTLLLAADAAAVIRVDDLIDRVRTLDDHEDPLVRRAALRALVRYSAVEARQLLVAALEDRNPDVRIAVVNALAEREDHGEAADALVDYARSESWRTGRLQAVRVLARIDTPETTEFFNRLLTLKDESDSDGADSIAADLELREIAASSLVRAGRAVRADISVGMLTAREGTSRKLRLRALDLLGLDESPERLDVLMAIARGEQPNTDASPDETLTSPEFRQRAMLALGRRRSAEARRLLESVAFEANSSTDVRTRRHAIRALGFYRDDGLLERLREFHGRAEPSLKPTIQQTISMIENRERIDSLRRRIETIEGDQQPRPGEQGVPMEQTDGPEGEGTPSGP